MDQLVDVLKLESSAQCALSQGMTRQTGAGTTITVNVYGSSGDE